MNAAASNPASLSVTVSPAPIERDVSPIEIDTTRGSMLHRMARFDGFAWKPVLRIYGYCVALTYLPLLLTALLTTRPLNKLWQSGGLDSLPLLLDANMMFTFFVSFPTLALLVISDDRLLRAALRQVGDSGVVRIDPDRRQRFQAEWEIKFRRRNLIVQILGAVFAAVCSWLTLGVYDGTKFWAAGSAEMSPLSWAFLYCITLLYTLIVIYVARCVFIAFLLRDLVREGEVRMLPFHPDGCGGLQPVGRIGLRNQYALTVLGLNIVALSIVTFKFLSPAEPERVLIAIAALIYLVLGPIVFMGPLLPFRKGMNDRKRLLLEEVADRLRANFENIRGQLRGGAITQSELDELERIRKIGAMIEELPVWPFDLRTLKKFGSAYIIPAALPAAAEMVSLLFAWIKGLS